MSTVTTLNAKVNQSVNQPTHYSINHSVKTSIKNHQPIHQSTIYNQSWEPDLTQCLKPDANAREQHHHLIAIFAAFGAPEEHSCSSSGFSFAGRSAPSAVPASDCSIGSAACMRMVAPAVASLLSLLASSPATYSGSHKLLSNHGLVF